MASIIPGRLNYVPATRQRKVNKAEVLGSIPVPVQNVPTNKLSQKQNKLPINVTETQKYNNTTLLDTEKLFSELQKELVIIQKELSVINERLKKNTSIKVIVTTVDIDLVKPNEGSLSLGKVVKVVAHTPVLLHPEQPYEEFWIVSIGLPYEKYLISKSVIDEVQDIHEFVLD